jgi:hypothetical protein
MSMDSPRLTSMVSRPEGAEEESPGHRPGFRVAARKQFAPKGRDRFVGRLWTAHVDGIIRGLPLLFRPFRADVLRSVQHPQGDALGFPLPPLQGGDADRELPTRD